MKTRSLTLTGVAVLALAASACAQNNKGWTQLSLSTCNVDKARDMHPKHDGRGVVIAVLDTGVDPSIPGLTHTPDGAVKVIDVQDFTGQGNIDLKRVRKATDQNAVIRHDDDGNPIHFTLPELSEAPAGNDRIFWMADFDERLFINSDVPDLNDNGTTDDKFPILVTACTGDGDDRAVAYIDTDADRDFADEKPLRNYKLDYDTFTLRRERPEDQIVPFAFAVNIHLRKPEIVIHWDDGAHGTHVAGIAAGYQINNQPDFHGVAPGAKLMSLKIGKNSVGGVSSTDAMKKAIRYAANFARETGMPVVCNMSYGVESVLEGQADIDKLFDQVLLENPGLVFCTSAGNEGPGLSTVGSPAAADHLISVAAMMAADTGRDVRGYKLDHGVVTYFSSRGGEVNKPDIATPGWATSTVPRYVQRGDFWAGTSMASPYAAGMCAVLISHCRDEFPDKPIRAWDIRQALRLSAKPIPGFTALDYGYGVPDMVAASKIIADLIDDADQDPIAGYLITTNAPSSATGRNRAAYWRALDFPSDEPQAFTIAPIFAPGIDAAARTGFTRKFNLRSKTPWCKVNQESVYLRSEQTATIYVEYDTNALSDPGAHTGIVEARFDGHVAFRLLNTIIVPHRFTPENNYTKRWTNQTVNGWVPERFFIAVPPGASAMHITISAPDAQKSKAHMSYLFDPTGRKMRRGGMGLRTEQGHDEAAWTIAENLLPGVWEIPIFAAQPDESWPFDLEVRFAGLHPDTPRITSWENGKGQLIVTNLYQKSLPANASGKLEGFRLHKEDKFKGLKDELVYTITPAEGVDALRLKLTMSNEAYAETTDIGVAVEDAAGEAIYSSAFSNRTFEARVPTRGKSPLKVVIRAGFAISDFERETPIDVKIDQLLASPKSMTVGGAGANVMFYPSLATRLEFSVNGGLPSIPDDHRPVGEIKFSDRKTDETVLIVPIDIGA